MQAARCCCCCYCLLVALLLLLLLLHLRGYRSPCHRRMGTMDLRDFTGTDITGCCELHRRHHQLLHVCEETRRGIKVPENRLHLAGQNDCEAAHIMQVPTPKIS